MQLVFFGTPEFAVSALRAIVREGRHHVAAVVTAPDRPVGRGRQVKPGPVKEFAQSSNLAPVLQPERLKDSDFQAELKDLGADCFVVAAFRILPESVYSMPPKGAFNLHASLLPKYRGAAPIRHALFNGETETGLTTFLLEKRVDVGRILMQTRVSIGPDDDYGSLHDRMAEAGAQLVLDTLGRVGSARIDPTPQDDSQASTAPKIAKRDLPIDLSWGAEHIRNRVRGLAPLPGAQITTVKHVLKLLRVTVSENSTAIEVGTITDQRSDGPVVAVGPDGRERMVLGQVKPAGARVMTGAEYMRGHRLNVGEQILSPTWKVQA